MRLLILFFASVLPSAAFAEVQPPVPIVVDGRVQWEAVDAVSINVHGEGGEWLETLSGDTTSWTPAEPGRYFFVSTDFGNWQGWGKSATVAVNDSDGDTDNLRIEVYSESAVELFWEHSPMDRAPIYSVFRDGIEQEQTRGSSYFDDSLEPGTVYQYEVRVQGRDGVVGVSSASTFGTGTTSPDAPLNQLPSVVTGLRADVYSSESLELYWGLASDADGRVVGYDVYRDGEPVDRVEGGSYFDIDLNPSTTYTYEVRAIDDTGAVGLPSSVSAMTFASSDPRPELPVAVELPGDCLLAYADTGYVFCFSAEEQVLMATRADGTLYWLSVLPDVTEERDVRALLAVDDKLLLIAELDAASGMSEYELSAFDYNGILQYAVPIPSGLEDASVVSHATRALHVLVDEGDLLLVGEYAWREGDGSAIGTFAARVDAQTGATQALRQFANQTAGRAPTLVDGSLILTLDGTVAMFDVNTLEAVVASPALTFNTSNYKESKELALSLLQSADFSALDTKLAEAIEAVAPNGLYYPELHGEADRQYEFSCPDGGSVSITGSIVGEIFEATVLTREYDFSDCSSSGRTISGGHSLIQNTFFYKYRREASNTTIYNGLNITESDSKYWRATASVVQASMQEENAAVSSRSSTTETVEITDYYADNTNESVAISGEYILGNMSATEYNLLTNEYESSSSTFERYSGEVSSVSQQNGGQIDVNIDPVLVNTSNDQSPTAGMIEISSSDGSSLVVDTNNGDPDTVQYRVSDGVSVTALDDVW